MTTTIVPTDKFYNIVQQIDEEIQLSKKSHLAIIEARAQNNLIIISTQHMKQNDDAYKILVHILKNSSFLEFATGKDEHTFNESNEFIYFINSSFNSGWTHEKYNDYTDREITTQLTEFGKDLERQFSSGMWVFVGRISWGIIPKMHLTLTKHKFVTKNCE